MTFLQEQPRPPPPASDSPLSSGAASQPSAAPHARTHAGPAAGQGFRSSAGKRQVQSAGGAGCHHRLVPTQAPQGAQEARPTTPLSPGAGRPSENPACSGPSWTQTSPPARLPSHRPPAEALGEAGCSGPTQANPQGTSRATHPPPLLGLCLAGRRALGQSQHLRQKRARREGRGRTWRVAAGLV